MVNKFIIYLIYLLPFSLVFSRFFSDFTVSLTAAIFFFLLIKKKLNSLFKNKFFLIFFIWCFYLIVASISSENVLLSLESSLFYFRFGLFVLVFSYLSNEFENFLQNFCLSFFIIISFLLADSFLQYLTGSNIFGYVHNGVKLSSFFKDEEILGSFLSRTYLIPIIGYLINKRRFKYENELFLTYLLLVFFVIFICGERTSFFIFFLNITILIFSYMSIFKKNIKYILIALILISSTLYLEKKQFKRVFIDTYYEFNLKINNSSIESFNIFTSIHTLHYITAYNMFKDKPFVGHGPKMFRELCKSKKYETGHYINKNNKKVWLNTNCATHPHNIYLQLLAETGIIGFFVIFIVFLICLSIIFKKISNINFKINDISYLSLVMIFCNLWPLMPSGNFFNNWISIIYFIPISILFCNFVYNKKHI
jgi:O-antigen ligase